MAKLLYTHIDPCNKKHLSKACHILKNDGVIAYPSDVNWAMGCHPKSSKAILRMQKMKPLHPKDQPFSLLCDSIGMVSKVAYFENSSYRLLRKALPGPYTIILERNKLLPRQIKDKRRAV